MARKALGVFPHSILAPASPYLRGFSDIFDVPVSRWTEVRAQEFPPDCGLSVLAASDDAGLCLVDDPAHRTLHMFNHLEYDTATLRDEYLRDGGPLPRSYFPGDDPGRAPVNRWRSHAQLLFGNWIGEVYQTTPFDVTTIGTDRHIATREACTVQAL